MSTQDLIYKLDVRTQTLEGTAFRVTATTAGAVAHDLELHFRLLPSIAPDEGQTCRVTINDTDAASAAANLTCTLAAATIPVDCRPLAARTLQASFLNENTKTQGDITFAADGSITFGLLNGAGAFTAGQNLQLTCGQPLEYVVAFDG